MYAAMKCGSIGLDDELLLNDHHTVIYTNADN